MPYIGRGPGFGVRSRFIYTATAGQTSFSGNDDAGISLAYTDTLYIDVYQNGVLLVPATDYASTTGTSVVLEVGASADDTVEMVVYDIFSVADSVSAKDGGTFSGTIAAAGLSTSSLGTSNFRAGVNAGNSIEAGGNYNVTVGDEAGTALTTGDDNTFIGYAAGDATTTATDNVAVGHDAFTANSTGGDNVAVGANALMANTTAAGNTGLGYQALKTNTEGHSNVAVGKNSLKLGTTGDYNVAVGMNALDANTTADNNTAVGYDALGANTTGTGNVAVGTNALDANTTANNNTAVGKAALGANTTGADNVAIGAVALDANTTGDNNTAVGQQALGSNTTADNNTAVGHDALAANTEGFNNTAVGSFAMDAVTTGDYNTGLGVFALTAETTGAGSTALGYGALATQNSTSSADMQNTAVGREAGTAVTTGIQNTFVGGLAGDSGTTAANNVIVGYNSDLAAVDTAQVVVLGSGVTSQAANNFTFGFGATDSNIAFGATSISAPSDVRLKEDIQDETVGLGFVNDLRPVTFQWKKEKDIPEEMKTHVAGSDTRVMNGKHNHGFIAQEVKAVIDKHEMKDGFDMWSEDPTDGRQRVGDASLMPIMVKALQELSAKNDALESRLAALEAK